MKWFEIRMVVVSVLGLYLLLAVNVPTAQADFVFGEPVNLGPPVNTSLGEGIPWITPDGLSLFFSRSGNWMATRPTKDAPWEEPVQVGWRIDHFDILPGVTTADGLEFFGDTAFDLLMRKRDSVDSEWGPPINLGPAVNTAAQEMWPTVSPDGLELYFSGFSAAGPRPGTLGVSDIWVTRRATRDDPWTEPVNLGPIINSTSQDARPRLSADGLVLVFDSQRAGGYGWGDLYMIRRTSLSAPWGPPVNLGPQVNTSWFEECAFIAADGSAIYFDRVLIGTPNSGDIWYAPIIPIVDFDGDGKVDGADLDLLIAHWGTDEPLCDIGPFAWGDGVVDEQDLKILMESLMTPGPRSSDVPREVVLNWIAPSMAESQDVYFGTSFEAVSTADRANPQDVLVSQGQTETLYIPPGILEFSQTYYWRVDFMIPDLAPAVCKGPVMQFTTEAIAYPVTNIIATASSSSEGMTPDKTVDGSGLNPLGRHSDDGRDMWLTSEHEALPAWIQFEFPGLRRLQQIKVWNYNARLERFVGYGAKDVVIEYSLDAQEWMPLKDIVIPRAPSDNTYAGAEPIDLEGIEAKFLRLMIETTWGGRAQTGLSEVQFQHIPMQAREPQPADGATGVAIDADLTWYPGREARSHQVYFGLEAEAVAVGAVPTASQTTRSYTPAALDLATTYYWRVDEVGETDTFEGNLWNFTTQEFLVVEDFERYNDKGNRIYETWIGGEVNETGSTVGYVNPSGGTFGERTIVRSGWQSMPIFYDNTGKTTAEAERKFAPAQDWTACGIKSLSLYFRGAPENTGQLYIKINTTKIPYDGDATDIKVAAWQVWNIDLSAVAGDMSRVTDLTIGIEGAGASGVLYIDDIRLYPQAPEFSVPVEPGTANLVAYYAFDGNANDGSGRGRHGTIQGNVTYVAGVTGQAIKLDGVAAHVTVASVGIAGAASRTISGWAKADTTTIPAWTNVFGFTGPSAHGQHFDIQAVGTTGSTTLGFYGLHRYGWEQNILRIDLEWHHLAATLDGTTVTWYGNGIAMGTDQVTNVNTPGAFRVGRRQDLANHFPGSVDEVRVYDRALSPGEIAWLAGVRTPRHKPF